MKPGAPDTVLGPSPGSGPGSWAWGEEDSISGPSQEPCPARELSADRPAPVMPCSSHALLYPSQSLFPPGTQFPHL